MFLLSNITYWYFRGQLTIKMEPKIVDNKEETELQQMLDRLAQENEEVDGDAPEDS